MLWLDGVIKKSCSVYILIFTIDLGSEWSSHVFTFVNDIGDIISVSEKKHLEFNMKWSYHGIYNFFYFLFMSDDNAAARK